MPLVIKNVVMFQAITIDGSSQLSFDHSKFDISFDGQFCFIRSKKTSAIRGTSFANIQCFTPEIVQDTPKEPIAAPRTRLKAVPKVNVPEETHTNC